MKEDNEFIPESASLRQKAETQLENNLSKISIPTTQEETSKLLRELQLQLIELELQNEKLRLQINPGLSTEHQHNQTILKSEEKYREIFGHMQDVYYETGINGEILEISPSVLAFSKGQYCREELIGQSISNFYTFPEERTAVLKAIFEHESVADYELSMTNKDGSTIPVAISSKVVFDAQGRPEKISGIMRDITRRKKSEEKIKENEANIQAIIENSFENVWSINTDYEIQYVNEQFVREFQKAFGVKLAKGVNILEALPNPLNILWKERYERAFNNEHFVFTDKIDLGETILYIEVGMNPIVVNGKVTGVSLYGKDITERRRIEESLKMNEEKFRNLFENSPVGISLTGFDGSIYLNKSGIGIIGYPEEEMNGKKWIDITYPDDVTMTTEALQSLLDGKCTTVRFEKRYIHKNGSIVWVDISMYLQSDSAGNPTSYVKIINDITVRKHAEEALKNSEAQFREFFEKSADAIFIAEIESGIIVDANEAASRLTLMQHDQIVGLHQSKLHPPIAEVYAKETFMLHKEAVKQNQEAHPFENNVLRSDGLRVPVEILAAKVTFQGKHFLMGTFRDITGRKQMETELIAAKVKAEESEQQLIIGNKELIKRNSFIQTILDNLPIGIALNKIDEGTATYMNKKFEEIYGWRSDEIISIGSFFERVYPDAEYRNKLISQIIADIQSGDPERMHWEDIFVTRKDGSKRVVNAVNIPLIEQNMMVSTVADITELHKTQNDLVAAKEKAEESDRLKSAFLANMSHELRTPLNSIIGFSELLTDPDQDTENHIKFAQMINNSGNNLLSIINDLMDISKIEAGQVQVRNEPVYVNYLVADIQKEYSYKALQKGIVLRINQLNSIEEIVIESDESKLRQILINFVGNSIKFTENGFIEIGISKTENYCQFYVKDTGIGIPEEFHNSIFERFRQIETAHTRKYGGNGLGLAISKSLVELLGGTIWMESVFGKGSIFYFSVPVKSI